MAKIDDSIQLTAEAAVYLTKYQEINDKACKAIDALSFSVDRLVVSFRSGHTSKLRVFVGSAELTRELALELAKGLLDVLGEGNK